MGLDAYVNCNCYQEGKTTPPPFPREWLYFDEEGYFTLTPEHASGQNWHKLNKWKETCCPHRSLHLAWERISNWAGVSIFMEALEKIGWDHFPALHQHFTERTGSRTSPDAAASILPELDHFESLGEIGVKTVLVDSMNNLEIQEYVPSHEGIFLMAGRSFKAGINQTEFFVLDSEDKILFRSRRFRQIITPQSLHFWKKKPDVHWQDLETGQTFASTMAITGRQIPWPDGSWETPDGRCNHEIPTELHVEQRPRTPADFEYIVKSLRTVFTASVQSSNPVIWC